MHTSNWRLCTFFKLKTQQRTMFQQFNNLKKTTEDQVAQIALRIGYIFSKKKKKKTYIYKKLIGSV